LLQSVAYKKFFVLPVAVLQKKIATGMEIIYLYLYIMARKKTSHTEWFSWQKRNCNI